jgi:hypothetical protein
MMYFSCCNRCKFIIYIIEINDFCNIVLTARRTARSSGRTVTQLKITIFQEKQFNYYFFLIRVLKIEESETANTYVGKKGILHT